MRPRQVRPKTSVTGLFVREGDRVVEAPEADLAVARSYPAWSDKGPLVDGKRLTLLSAKECYDVGEQVRVIHAVEYVAPGDTVYIMGPKPVVGEYVDGRLVTPAPPADRDPLVPLEYDGATLPSPGVDFNYEVTVYSFSEPGEHEISWRLDGLRSNTLTARTGALEK